jgi:hypothetical protein
MEVNPEASSCAASTRATMLWHVDRYPRLDAADLYKLAHEGAAGPGHAIQSLEGARAWLDREWATIGDPLPAEPQLEPLPGAAGAVRVNLRPWKRLGGTQSDVLAAFVDAARRVTMDPEELARRLDASGACLRELGEAGLLPVSALEIQRYFERLRQEGYPAVHHTERYRDAYAPAYRVVLEGALAPRRARE